jgi:hypothetical protein
MVVICAPSKDVLDAVDARVSRKGDAQEQDLDESSENAETESIPTPAFHDLLKAELMRNENEDDHVNNVDDLLAYCIALKNVRVPVEMRLYAQGGRWCGRSEGACAWNGVRECGMGGQLVVSRWRFEMRCEDGSLLAAD